MSRARVTLDRDFTVGEVPRRIFGSFVEHMGRCVYTGIYEPGHPTADEQRLPPGRPRPRQGARARRSSGTPAATSSPGTTGRTASARRTGRGGSTAPGTRSRPTRSGCTSSWTGRGVADVEVMEAINLGTRGVDEARALVEYANHPGGTELSDLRRKNGHEDPFDIRLWCLGNEMDGPWQIGHKTADEYGRLAQEAAKAMRLVDPTIELVAVRLAPTPACRRSARGSRRCSGTPTTRSTTSRCTPTTRSTTATHASFLASAVDMDYFIESVIATADAVRAKGKHKKHIDLSFDEWNVWYQRGQDTEDQPHVIEKAGAGASTRGSSRTSTRHRRRRRRHLPQLAAAPRRPREDRQPGPAGQRDRARSARRRAARPGGRRSSGRSRGWRRWPAGSDPADRGHLGPVRQREVRRRWTWSTSAPPGTRSTAASRSSWRNRGLDEDARGRRSTLRGWAAGQVSACRGADRARGRRPAHHQRAGRPGPGRPPPARRGAGRRRHREPAAAPAVVGGGGAGGHADLRTPLPWRPWTRSARRSGSARGSGEWPVGPALRPRAAGRRATAATSSTATGTGPSRRSSPTSTPAGTRSTWRSRTGRTT